ncbi:ATPase, F0 complex, subunit B/B', bacterial/chloroplast [Actinidia rufa]|uniref:ATPase, F0 complex, subunit B/B', bacterial/chloroplast n=1 Tax=Actinidia rufa TaxID=165716 RepID=A0A7J0GC08_9ERIC|nr:ATPase, F0 complex, subunit B/B', bacterial/chloroplast [Actinidia rufa]
MANMIMASSSKTLIPPPSSSTPKPKHLQFPKFPKPQLTSLSTPTSLKSLAAVAVAALAAAPPSLAEEFEKAALFDFNLTLPIIMAEFLFLMVALDKVWFSPLGKFMDDRDAQIREMLSGVKDTSSEVKELEEKATAVMRAARAEIAAALNVMKKETTEEVERRLWRRGSGRWRLRAEGGPGESRRGRRTRPSRLSTPRLRLSVRILSRRCSLSKSPSLS